MIYSIYFEFIFWIRKCDVETECPNYDKGSDDEKKKRNLISLKMINLEVDVDYTKELMEGKVSNGIDETESVNEVEKSEDISASVEVKKGEKEHRYSRVYGPSILN